MVIKSNILKNPVYPEDFTEEDKMKFDELSNEAQIIHKNVYENEPFIIYYSIVFYIRKLKGLEQSFTDDELQNLIKSYELKNTNIKCNGDEIDYLYDKENNPIFKDNDYFFKKKNEDDNDSNIVETENKLLTTDKITI